MAAYEFYTTNNWTDPSDAGEAVTPSDTGDLSRVSRRIYVGATGDVTVIMATDGSTLTFKSVPTGTFLPIRVTRVKATGTSATQLLALY